MNLIKRAPVSGKVQRIPSYSLSSHRAITSTGDPRFLARVKMSFTKMVGQQCLGLGRGLGLRLRKLINLHSIYKSPFRPFSVASQPPWPSVSINYLSVYHRVGTADTPDCATDDESAHHFFNSTSIRPSVNLVVPLVTWLKRGLIHT